MEWRGGEPLSPESNESYDGGVFEEQIVDDRSFDDEAFEQQFRDCVLEEGAGSVHQLHSLATHAQDPYGMGNHYEGEGHYDIDEDFDGSYIDEEADYYGHEYEGESSEFDQDPAHIGAEEVQEVLEEDLEVEECDFDDDFGGGNTNLGMTKKQIVSGRMITAPEAADLRRLVFGGGSASVALPLEG